MTLEYTEPTWGCGQLDLLPKEEYNIYARIADSLAKPGMKGTPCGDLA